MYTVNDYALNRYDDNQPDIPADVSNKTEQATFPTTATGSGKRRVVEATEAGPCWDGNVASLLRGFAHTRYCRIGIRQYLVCSYYDRSIIVMIDWGLYTYWVMSGCLSPGTSGVNVNHSEFQ